MTDRVIIGVVLPEGYTGASDFATDCKCEVIGTCSEEVYLRASKPYWPTMDEAYRWIKSNPKTAAEILAEVASGDGGPK